MIEGGRTDRLGACWDGSGVNFAVYSADAEAIELCLFDGDGTESARITLPEQIDGVWHGYLPGCSPGQLYGYRAHGRYEPAAGLRFNPHKLLVDPYARQLRGSVLWQAPVFDYDRGRDGPELVPSTLDSARYVPKCVVQGSPLPAPSARRIPWSETVIYEANVRGYTMLHPAIPELDRGTFRGMRQHDVLLYLKSLGITSLELMPIHSFVDEEFLAERSLRNFWGYNTLNFFAPAERYLGDGGIDEFRQMVDAIHDLGIEIILDVVYNHTAEGGRLGPTLSFRGLDNRTYYWLMPDDAAEYVNDTGCGNTIDTEHEAVRRLILDSLRYWVAEMGVDGFRFDLATVLGRTRAGFADGHPLFDEMARDPVLRDVKLIAEPWDVGPGGYQLGGFPAPWAEWNDKFRDTVRRFWCGDEGLAPDFARRVHGSADLFEPGGRGPTASINFVASHDGFTLADSVSYLERHNEANGQQNQDGHSHNYSLNYGVEGETDDPAVEEPRRRHRLNMLATLFLSQGTPMLLAGDELGNSQRGNNNAYAQDNEIGWIDWTGLEDDREFVDRVRQLISVRKSIGLLRQPEYRHRPPDPKTGAAGIEWFGSGGETMSADEWHTANALGLLLTEDGVATAVTLAAAVKRRRLGRSRVGAVALLFNAGQTETEFTLPPLEHRGRWRCEFTTSAAGEVLSSGHHAILEGRSAACLIYRYS